jgi:hypothetical protein
MNRKGRKKRKMQLRRMGLEVFTPDPKAMISTSSWNFPSKLLKHYKDGCIEAGRLSEYEFTKVRKKK